MNKIWRASLIDENATLVLVSKSYSIVYMIAQKSNPRFKLELFVESARNWIYVQKVNFGKLC